MTGAERTLWFQRGGLWGNRDFVLLWAAATSSSFGSMVRRVAMPFVAILVLDAGPVELGLLAAADIIPGFALGLFAGMWADRVRRRPILIVADIGRALLLASVPLAAVLGALRIEHLYAVSILTSSLAVFFGTAHLAYLPTLVEKSSLVEANAKLAGGDSVAEAAAFPVAGWLVQWLTAPAALLVDALSFLASAAWLAKIRHVEPARRKRRERHVWREIGEGLAAVWESPALLAIGIFQTTVAFSFRLLGVVYMLFVTRELGFAPGLLGMIFALGSLASVGGALIARRVSYRIGLGPSVLIGMALGGGAMLFLPAAVGATLGAAVLLSLHQVVGDGPMTVSEISATTLVQISAPSGTLGRVAGSFRFAGFAAMLLGVAVGAALGETVGLRVPIVLAGSVQLLAAAGLCLTPLRQVGSGEVASPHYS